MTRDKARRLFRQAGLTYEDLTRESLQRLRNLINDKMKESGCFKDTYRCKQRPFLQIGGTGRFWAGIGCKAFYFEDREAVSFNGDGFIGFAGWASDDNVAPILGGLRRLARRNGVTAPPGPITQSLLAACNVDK